MKKKTDIFCNVNGNINVRERSLHKKKENKKFMWFTEIGVYIIYVYIYTWEILLLQKYLSDALTEVIFLYDSQNRAINLRKNE